MWFFWFHFRTKNKVFESICHQTIIISHFVSTEGQSQEPLISPSHSLPVSFLTYLQSHCRVFLYNVDMMSFILLLFLNCHVWMLLDRWITLVASHNKHTYTYTPGLCGTLVSLCLSFSATQSHWKDSERLLSGGHLGLPSYWCTHTHTQVHTNTHTATIHSFTECYSSAILQTSVFQPLCRGTPHGTLGTPDDLSWCRERSSGVPWEIIQIHLSGLKNIFFKNKLIIICK